jgi:cytoskeleton protein RodZ
MTSEAGGEDARGIGARLRAAREKRGLTILQAAEKLHVDAWTLEALEAEDFAALGAPVYVRGHLRRYAEAVGESAAELQERYSSGTQAARPDLTRIPHGEPRERASPLMPLALLVVVGFAIGGAVWWVRTLPKAQPVTAQWSAPAAAPVPEAQTTAASDVPPAGAAEGSAPPAALPAGGAAAVSTPHAQLGVRFSGQSWVEITDADGRRLLQGLIEAGNARALAGTPPLHVVLGNAPAVALELNGHPVTLDGLVHRDGSARLMIDGTGRISAAAPRLAHGE